MRSKALLTTFGVQGKAACRHGLCPEAAAIRAAYLQQGKLSAAVELRRLFPVIAAETERRRQCTPPPGQSM